MKKKLYSVIIQARMGSTRLPNKVLKKIGNQKVIELLIQRLRKVKKISKIIVATTTSSEDDVLCDFLEKKKINFFRGPKKNVLKRFYLCAKINNLDNIFRITADCPLVDPEIINEAIRKYDNKKIDYLSNTLPPSFPDGLDFELFNFDTLKKTFLHAKKKYDLEHVTSYMRNHKNFKKLNIKSIKDFSHLRWTLDETHDLFFLNALSKKISLVDANYNEILKILKKFPEINKLNNFIKRNEGSVLGEGQKLWKRAKEIIPGGNMLLSKRSEMFLPNLWPSYFNSSKYNYIKDLDGKKYIDFIFAVGQNILGYRNLNVEKKVISSLKKGNMTTLNSFEEVNLAQKLIEMHPWFDMVRFARSGGEANAIAIRIARAATNKQNVAICGYHGWHDWYLAANIKSNNNLETHLLPGLDPNGVNKKLKDTVFPFEYNNFDQLKKIVKEKNIGIIKMEVTRNFGPKNNFLKRVRDLCNKKKIVLIFDECTSGFRESFGGIHKKFKIRPDMAMFGKALGNGHAITAVIGKREVMENAQKTFISSTFWTERIGSVAGNATLDEMSRIKSWEIITQTGKKIKENWLKLAKENNLNINITGLDALCSFSFNSKDNIKYKTFITQEMLSKGYLASNIVYVSIAHDQKSMNGYFERLSDIFKIIKKCENKTYNIDKFLKTSQAHTTFKRLN